MNARFATALLASFLAMSVGSSSVALAAAPIRVASLSPFAASRLALAPADRGVASDVAVLRDGRVLGRASAVTPIHIAVLMRAQHEAEMKALVAAQSQPGSRYYHRYLSSSQFVQYFAPSTATIALTETRLRAAGFRIEHVNANRTLVSAVAPAAVASRYFRTSFALVRQGTHPVAYANVTPAIVPDELRTSIVSVAGLHSFRSVRTDHQSLSPAGRAALRTRSRLFGARPFAAARPPAQRVAIATPSPYPSPISTATAKPGPDPTDMVETPASDGTLLGGTPGLDNGYGPPIFSVAYDYPTQHGYNGNTHATGSVIDVDYSDSDLGSELGQYSLPARTPGVNEFRVCYDGTTAVANPSATASCYQCVDNGTIAKNTNCDADGESGLDAETLMSMAPGASFYEFIAPLFDDAQLEGAYETAVAQDNVDAVNSSFGECETDDPGFEYSANYIALEGALEGITFSASAGDTGGESCGIYADNGVPQSLTNVSEPAAAPYFTAVGGTSFEDLTAASTNDYTAERAWMEGGGGSSVITAAVPWQTAAIAAASAANMDITTGRDLPDLSFTADGGPGFIGGTEGNGLIICSEAVSQSDPCNFTGSGGTSLASPLFIALQTEINEVTGTRHGWVNPRLYAVAVKYPGFGFRDITLGNNERYNAGSGYDMATGLGTPLGFELATAE